MNYSLFILIPFLAFKVHAFDKDFKVETDRLPTEFVLLFDSMKLQIKNDVEKFRMVGLIQDMNTNLRTLDKSHMFLLLKSEVIKDVLEYKFDKVRQFDMTSLLVGRLNSDYKVKQKLLTPFASWIWRSVLAELKNRQDMGLITERSFNPENFEGAKLVDARRFQKYLNYLLPWVDRMESLPPTQFNELVKEVSWVILRRINERSMLFKRFVSSSASGQEANLFNIPPRLTELRPEDIKRLEASPAPEPTLAEKSKIEASTAQEKVDAVTPDDMSAVSDDVLKAIDGSIKAGNPE